MGITGKYGVRYGSSLRKTVKKMEVSQHSKYTCVFCGKDSVKRTSVGIWNCGSCRKVVAGGAYLLATAQAAQVSQNAPRLAPHHQLRARAADGCAALPEAADKRLLSSTPPARRPVAALALQHLTRVLPLFPHSLAGALDHPPLARGHRPVDPLRQAVYMFVWGVRRALRVLRVTARIVWAGEQQSAPAPEGVTLRLSTGVVATHTLESLRSSKAPFLYSQKQDRPFSSQ